MAKWLLSLVGLPVMLCAQMPRGVWWEGKVAQDLNLTDAQSKQIKATVKEFHDRMFDLRAAVNKAESDLETVFNEDPVDQRKANETIERLASARADLFRSTSQMELKFRGVLTAQQWQELKARQPMRTGPGGPRRWPPKDKGRGTATTTIQQP